MRKWLFIFFAMVFLFSLHAYAIPQQINFQGRLASSDATPIKNPKNVTFNLYNAPTAGTLISTETISIIPNDNGVFSVLLGFDSSRFNGVNERYLEIQVESDPPMTPRQKIAAVPYAYRAITAESVVGLNNYVLKTGDKMMGGLTIEGAGLKVSGTVETGGGIKFPDGIIQTKAVTQETGNPPAHAIGESYGGGIVFYVYDSGQHGLIASRVDQSLAMQWHIGPHFYTLARANGVGGGKKNTELLIAVQGFNVGNIYAARACNEYSTTEGSTTYDDWYLPSLHELNLLWQQRGAVGGFPPDMMCAFYWSSTECLTDSQGTDYAWQMRWPDGQQDIINKGFAQYVRAIRAF